MGADLFHQLPRPCAATATCNMTTTPCGAVFAGGEGGIAPVSPNGDPFIPHPGAGPLRMAQRPARHAPRVAGRTRRFRPHAALAK